MWDRRGAEMVLLREPDKNISHGNMVTDEDNIKMSFHEVGW
jgi:hypothetical protein